MRQRSIGVALGLLVGLGGWPAWAAGAHEAVAPARAVGLAASPGPSAEALACLQGRALYRERIALAPDARLTVRLVDVSLADAPATVLSEGHFRVAGGPPIPFQLAYDPRLIRANHRYAVELELSAGGKRWINTTQQPVLTQGAAGLPDEIVLEAVR